MSTTSSEPASQESAPTLASGAQDPAPSQHQGEGVAGQAPKELPEPAPGATPDADVAASAKADTGAEAIAGAKAATADEVLVPEDEYAPAREPINISWIYLGYRQIDEAFWSPLDDQATLGFELSRERPGKYFGGEVGVNLGASTKPSSENYDQSSVLEFYGGLRKTWGDLDRRWHPYVGFGVSALRANLNESALDFSDWGFAPYVHGGIHYDLSERFTIGVDIRSLFASSVEIAGVSGDVDYLQFALALGWLF